MFLKCPYLSLLARGEEEKVILERVSYKMIRQCEKQRSSI